MDPYTFGNSPAAVKLAEVLSTTDPKLAHRITKILNGLGRTINYIENSSKEDDAFNLTNKGFLAELARKHTFEVIENMKCEDSFIRTLTMNIAKTKYKMYFSSLIVRSRKLISQEAKARNLLKKLQQER